MTERDPEGSTPDAGRDPMDTPLLAVLRRYEEDGFTGQFASAEGARVHCYSCGESFAAETCQHGKIRRLEGASDPADMLAVIPVRCAGCGVKGVVVANFGPEATISDAEVLAKLDRAPPDGGAGAEQETVR